MTVKKAATKYSITSTKGLSLLWFTLRQAPRQMTRKEVATKALITSTFGLTSLWFTLHPAPQITIKEVAPRLSHEHLGTTAAVVHPPSGTT